MRQFKTEILGNRIEKGDYYTLLLRKPRGLKKALPGQILNIRINDKCDPLLRRPFGVHDEVGGRIAVLYKVVGKATRELAGKRKGDILDVLGPLGNGFDLKRAGGRHAVLVGGGHGVAPLYALAKNLSGGRRTRLTVLIGAKSGSLVVCRSAFIRLGAKVLVATDDGSMGHKGVVTDLLEKTVTRGPAVVYACGPKPMLRKVAEITLELDIACQLSMEEYMGCGTGVCMGCSVDTVSGKKLVCKDGPVFEAKEITWDS
ncbi:MAG: dihydroorotate dehydrogenase electron transfer subunit [Candidatus Omnitrophota bacterium]